MGKSHLTKSRFTTAYGCARKLYYMNNADRYGSDLTDDKFMEALAEGGFQVGALAQQYHPGGVLIDTLDKQAALAQTAELLKHDRIIIFEGAFAFENLFIRADIVRKNGAHLELIEVKAKSFNSEEGFRIWDSRALKRGEYKLLGEYESYVLDVAFQTHVINKAYPKLNTQSFLMLTDTAKRATVEALNQKFKLKRGADGRNEVHLTASLTPEQLGEPVLTKIDLTDDIKKIFNEVKFEHGRAFGELVTYLAGLAGTDTPGEAAHGTACKGCEFRVVETAALQSGFKQCWTEKGIAAKDIESRPFVFEVWNFRGAGKAIEHGVYFADQLTTDDIALKPREDGKAGLSVSERQHLQIEQLQGTRKGEYFNAKDFHDELRELKFPLHFIDFETSMVAIPFHVNRRPYEQMAFQFSHHVLHQDGRIEHRSEYLDDRVGLFPNYDFVRALKNALSGDDGAVLRFAAHENTVLNQIRAQLQDSAEPDAAALIAWIESLTSPPSKFKGEWEPKRQFVDMCELTKRFYYLPDTGGSNSIKKILPAVLRVAGSKLKDRFPEWIQWDAHGRIMDPYKLLPPLFSGVDAQELARLEERIVTDDSLADGGAAMMAWAKMQFTEMSTLERTALREALLRYCGLDTLAMVMIWEWWQLEIQKVLKAA